MMIAGSKMTTAKMDKYVYQRRMTGLNFQGWEYFQGLEKE